jgi:hypothetical protein
VVLAGAHRVAAGLEAFEQVAVELDRAARRVTLDLIRVCLVTYDVYVTSDAFLTSDCFAFVDMFVTYDVFVTSGGLCHIRLLSE